MDGDWDALVAKVEYATTPLELMALAELPDGVFSTLCAENNDALRSNLDVLARLVPPSYMGVQDVHDHLEPKVTQARRASRAFENVFTSYENDDTPMPLITKVGFLKLAHLTGE